MKIILDNTIFSLQRAGGISLYWTEIIKALIADKINVSCIERNSDFENIFRQEIESDFSVIHEKNRKLNRILPVKYNTTGQHIFHSSYYRIPQTNQSVKKVTTIHDLIPEKKQMGIRHKLIAKQKYESIKDSDAIVCVSENTKKDLLEIYPEFSVKNIQVIYNGVSESFFPVNDESLLQTNFYLAENFCLFVGKRDNYKNFSFAVEFVESISNLQLVIVGENLSYAEKRNLEKKLRGRYLSLSFISTPVLNILYNKAHFLMYPTSYEGFGIPVIEAQKSGCPVIAQDTSSIAELISDKKMLMPDLSLQSAKRVLSYVDENKKEIINNGFENSKKFTWKKSVKKHIELYSTLYNTF